MTPISPVIVVHRTYIVVMSQSGCGILKGLCLSFVLCELNNVDSYQIY